MKKLYLEESIILLFSLLNDDGRKIKSTPALEKKSGTAVRNFHSMHVIEDTLIRVKG